MPRNEPLPFSYEADSEADRRSKMWRSSSRRGEKDGTSGVEKKEQQSTLSIITRLQLYVVTVAVAVAIVVAAPTHPSRTHALITHPRTHHAPTHSSRTHAPMTHALITHTPTHSSRTRLDVMLGSIQGSNGRHESSNKYAILYLDAFTTQILSNICGIADLLDYGISLVDNINNTKPTKQDKVYFVTPTDANIALLTNKHKHSSNVHVFFTTSPSPFQLEDIKKSSQLLGHLVTLKEANVEYVMNPDARGFTTGPEDALTRFYCHGAELLPEYDEELYQVANRLASLFVTMKEMPSIRYRAALPPESHEYPHGLESRLLVTQRLAVEVSKLLEHYQGSSQVPEGETCELIIVDRGMDAVAPIVHEWTYESMVYDLLSEELTEGRNVYQGHVLNDKDAMFVKVRGFDRSTRPFACRHMLAVVFAAARPSGQ